MRKRSRFARYNRKNPTTTDYALAGAGILVVAGVGYWIYSQSQSNAQTAASTSSAGGYPNAPGTFANTGSGQVGPASGGEGTLPFNPQQPGFPGPTGPNVAPSPLPPFPSPPV